MTDLIGRWCCIPATIEGQGVQLLKLDLYDPHCLRFALNDTPFVVSREAVTALIAEYTKAQERVKQHESA